MTKVVQVIQWLAQHPEGVRAKGIKEFIWCSNPKHQGMVYEGQGILFPALYGKRAVPSILKDLCYKRGNKYRLRSKYDNPTLWVRPFRKVMYKEKTIFAWDIPQSKWSVEYWRKLHIWGTVEQREKSRLESILWRLSYGLKLPWRITDPRKVALMAEHKAALDVIYAKYVDNCGVNFSFKRYEEKEKECIECAEKYWQLYLKLRK